MRARRSHPTRHAAIAAGTGLLLLGIATTPAYADTIRSRQWHLDAMRADDIWKISTGKGVTVAVIDSGVDNTLADLKGQVLDGISYSKQNPEPHKDIVGHGTSMAALIAATGARGTINGSYGLAPGSKILPIKMLENREETGIPSSPASYAVTMPLAIRYAADSDARVINISMGSLSMETPALNEAVAYALKKGKLIFAATGNKGDTTNPLEYPAATPGVIGVGSVNKKAIKTASSSSGPQVDLAAPGEDIVTACPESDTKICRSDGTSDATALASASAALIWSAHPNWTNNQVLRVMLNTAGGPTDGAERNNSIGYGIVRPYIALTNPGDPGPADEYPLPDLTPTASASTPASPSASPTPSTEPAAAAPSDSTTHWLALGAAATAIIGAAIALPLILARRRKGASIGGFTT